jgi:gliding motility-associated protein GldE
MEYSLLAVLLVLLICSGLISGSEVAFFSLSPAEMEQLKKNRYSYAVRAIRLLSDPPRLLATILIANNIINISFIILSVWISGFMFDFSGSPVLKWVVQGGVVTLLLLFFGELLPKVWASGARMSMVALMALPLSFLSWLLWPLAFFMVRSSGMVNRRARQRKEITMDDLSHAISLASEDLREDEKILKGIVSISNISVKEIMQPRLDVVYVDIKAHLTKITSVVVESGFSRIPVVAGDFDHVQGILYIKDLLPHINKSEFKWQSLIRPPYFVPENKPINDLLSEFQTKKIHMAVVVDEYGGSSGIVTLEDILEEIVGDITDEFDTDEPGYYQVDDKTWVFEAKTQLMDFYRILGIEEDIFEYDRGETDSLGGLVLEKIGRIPNKNEEIGIGQFIFKIKSADNRRIKQIYVSLQTHDGKKHE